MRTLLQTATKWRLICLAIAFITLIAFIFICLEDNAVWAFTFTALESLLWLVAGLFLFTAIVVPPTFSVRSVAQFKRFFPTNFSARIKLKRNTKSSLILSGFRGSAIFKIYTTKNKWFISFLEKGAEQSKTAGYADLRMVKLWRREPTFVALFVRDMNLELRVNEKCYCISTDSIAVKRESVFPCVKRFVISQGGSVLFSVKYWWADIHEWPDDDMLDIFMYISEQLKNEKSKLSFIEFRSS